MRGKSKIKKRVIAPDKKYNSLLIAELINKLTLKGYKTKSEKIVYKSFDIVEKNLKKPPFEVFDQAVKIASPQIEVRSKRIGGANYQVPVEVLPHRKVDLVIRWLLAAARTRHGKPMEEKLADEIILMSKGEGAVIKKRDDVHRMAEANKAFAHFARF